MHEVSLCRKLLEIINDQAKLKHFSQVKSVTLEIGALSCIDKSSLAFSFQALSTNTAAHQAKLKFIDIPATAYCPQCDEDTTAQQYFSHCPQCHGALIKYRGGDDLKVSSLEVS